MRILAEISTTTLNPVLSKFEEIVSCNYTNEARVPRAVPGGLSTHGNRIAMKMLQKMWSISGFDSVTLNNMSVDYACAARSRKCLPLEK